MNTLSPESTGQPTTRLQDPSQAPSCAVSLSAVRGSFLRYWLAMNASAFQAAAHAAKAYVALALASAAGAGVPALNWKQLAAVFLFAFGQAILNWLAEHPLNVPLARENGGPRTEASSASVAAHALVPAPAAELARPRLEQEQESEASAATGGSVLRCCPPSSAPQPPTCDRP